MDCELEVVEIDSGYELNQVDKSKESTFEN